MTMVATSPHGNNLPPTSVTYDFADRRAASVSLVRDSVPH